MLEIPAPVGVRVRGREHERGQMRELTLRARVGPDPERSRPVKFELQTSCACARKKASGDRLVATRRAVLPGAWNAPGSSVGYFVRTTTKRNELLGAPWPDEKLTSASDVA